MRPYSALRITTPSVFLAVILASATSGLSIAGGQETKPVREQTVFRESEEFQRPVPLPPKVLAALLRTKEVKKALESASKNQRDNPSELFQAAEVHLKDLDEVALIVEGFPPGFRCGQRLVLGRSFRAEYP